MCLYNFFHWDTEEIVNASPWRTWEVCDNLWQEGQEETKYRPVSILADCQRVPVHRVPQHVRSTPK
jgi:hypothetical protein